MTIIDVAKQDRKLVVHTYEKTEHIFLRLVLANGSNWSTVLTIDECAKLVETLTAHMACAGRGHDALAEDKFDPFTGATRMKVCRRCGDEWPTSQ